MPDRDSRRSAGPRRIVRVRDSGLEWQCGQAETGPVFALVASEEVLFLGVDLPAPRLRDRRAALPWAVEEALAEPLSELHLVLGPSIGPMRYLAAVVRHATMHEWRAIIEAGGIKRCKMIPDALALPVVPIDTWSIALDGERILVRGDCTTAFAIEARLFPEAWVAAGRPSLELVGEPAEAEIAGNHLVSVDPRPLALVLSEGFATAPIDLAQGPHAFEEAASVATLRRVAGILGIGIAASTLIMAADTEAVVRLAHQRMTEAIRMHADIIPADRRTGDIGADIAALARSANSPQGSFLPLMGRAAGALRPLSAEVSLRTLSFSAEEAAVTLGVQARDFAALQRIETVLAAVGIAADTGPAATVAGGVEAKIKLHGRPS